MKQKSPRSVTSEFFYRLSIVAAIATIVGLICGAVGVKVALIICAVIFGLEAVSDILSKPTTETIGHVVITVLCIAGTFVSSAYNKAKKDYDSISEYPTIADCEAYLNNHTHFFRDGVLDMYLNCAIEKGIFELDKLADNYPQTSQGEDAAHRASVIAYELYKQAEEQDYTDSWENYYENVPEKYHSDAKERAERAELRDWGTDEAAWKTAQKRDELKYYQKYLEKYPKGAYTARAKKGTIDTRVRDIMVKSNGGLPSATKISSNNSAIASQRITNDTGYPLTVLYSGAKRSYEFTIEPNRTLSFNILAGNYNIAVTVPNPLVIGYYKNENYSGGLYDTSYYIVKSRFRLP